MRFLKRKLKLFSGLLTRKNKIDKIMKIHSVIRKGEDHAVFCEDFMTTGDSGRYFLGVVFDGCSGGNDSHFASSLFGKIFKQIISEGAMAGNTIEEKSKNFVQGFVKKLFEVKVSLQLENNDMLATFVMLIYDKVHGEALTLTVGDGVIHCDGQLIILENERFKFTHPDGYKDMPDYIAYDLVDLGLDRTYFNHWYDEHVKVNKFTNPKDISISTDGILTFKTPEEEVDPVNFLLIDDTWNSNKIMLSKKVNVLKTKYKTVHKDDISMIRLILNSEENDNSGN